MRTRTERHRAAPPPVSASTGQFAALQAIVEQTGAAVAIWEGPAGGAPLRLIHVSPAFTELTGYTLDEVRGTERVFEPLAPGESRRDELALRRRDGTEVRAEVTYVLVPAEAARVYGVGSYRTIAPPSLSESQLRSLIEHVSDVVALVDGDGIIRYVSPSVQGLIGYCAEEMIGRGLHEFLDPTVTPPPGELLPRLVDRAARDNPRLITLLGPDGTPRTLVVHVRDALDDPAVGGIVITVQDVSERSRAEDRAQEALAHSERRFRALVQHSSDIITLIDRAGSVRYASPALERVLGLPPGSEDGTSLLDRVHPDDLPTARAAIAGTAVGGNASGAPDPIEVRLRASDGTWRHVEILSSNLLDDPDVGGLVLTARDVTDRHLAQQLLAQEAALLEAIARRSPAEQVLPRISMMIERLLPPALASIGVLEGDGVIRHRSAPTLAPALIDMLDAVDPASDLGGALRREAEPLVVFPDVRTDPRWEDGRHELAAQGLVACWVLTVTAPTSGELLGVLAVFHPEPRSPSADELQLLRRSMHLASIAIERGRFEAKLEHQALHDSLTGLPNRTLLIDRIEHALAQAARRNSLVAVLFVDLDQFKVINDSLGHAAGDRLLEQVAVRLHRALRTGDTVGRFGGDEFLVLCEDVDGEAGAVGVAERLADGLRAPFELDGAEVFVSASIGIALAADVAAAPDSLIRDADAAMYRAKERGRNRYELFEEDLHRRMVQRLELERALRQALPAGELRLHYQPQVRLADGRITGVEALVRWERPGTGLVSADAIVPVAEETGLIVPLGEWVLGEACRQAILWDELVPGPPLSLFVNLSARQLAEPDLVDLVSGVLETTGLEPSRLCLEVTESVLFHDADACVAVLSRLKGTGARLAIDDFGTGYATLDYVRRFSMADELKIDRSFVAGLDHFDSLDAAIVSAAIVLASALGFETVAEGVETAAQLSVLRRLGCDQAQGFYFSPPLDAGGTLDLLRAQGAFT